MVVAPASEMDAWSVERPGPLSTGPLRSIRTPVPSPVDGEILVRVLACAVCRTDLHVVEGDLAAHRPKGVVPGHEVVGEVAAVGPGVEDWAVGDRAGIAWLRHTCGRCRFCRRGAENLCPESRYTGWDADGGYAEYAVAPADFAYHLPPGDPTEIAPLLCAGIIGWRALRRAQLPAGGNLGIYGFGASAHLTAQVAVAEGAQVHVVTRSAPAQRLALDLGAASAGGAAPPVKLDAAILFAPVGDLVPVALAALDRGGTLAVAGIHLTDIPSLNYEAHLFQERNLHSVTANTRQDGRDFLAHATEHRLRVAPVAYPLGDAPRALADLAGGAVSGVAVLVT